MRLLDPLASAVSPLWALTNTVARPLLSHNARQLAVPVVSVGNIVAGGVGKTELACAIAQKFLEQKKRVVIASRGYGSDWEKKGAIAQDFTTALAHGFPDESLVHLKKAPGVSVAVGANRYQVLTRHWEELSPDLIVLDDGYQHFAIKRDLDILVHDFNNRWPILRDLPSAFRKVELRVALSEVPERIKSSKYEWVRAQYLLEGCVDSYEKVESLPESAFVFCGIANPQRLISALKKLGLHIKGVRTFRDHHAYTVQDARALADWAEHAPLLTTLKDFVKISAFAESQGGLTGFDPKWIKLKLQFIENEALFWKGLAKF